MGIYIKGMEMPTGGRILIIFPSGRVLEVSADATQDIFRETQAFPVPPHGRLGDLDELYKEAFKRSETKDGYYDCLDPVISCYTIEDAPTIIPAEPAEDGQ